MKIITGIFWVIEEKIIFKKHYVETNGFPQIKNWLDYPLSHYTVWYKFYSKFYPNADFATFPRGRIIYKINQNKFFLYADKCIKTDKIIEIIKLFNLENENYEIKTDEHYMCDKCVNNSYLFSTIYVAKSEKNEITTCLCSENEIKESKIFTAVQNEAFIAYFDSLCKYDLHNNSIKAVWYEDRKGLEKPRLIEIFGKNAPNLVGRNAFANIFKMTGRIANSENMNFAEFAKNFGVNKENTAENIAKLELTVAGLGKIISDYEADNLLADSLVQIRSIADYGIYRRSRLGENMSLLYKHNCLEDIKQRLQRVFNAIGEKNENESLTEYEISDLSFALYKAAEDVKDYDGEDIFANPCSYEFSKFIESKYKYSLRVKILRGENELTGNLIEIGNGFNTILTECGRSLENDRKELEAVEKEVLSKKYNAVIVSHNHIDHDGLIGMVNKDTPVYIGKKALELWKIQNPDLDSDNFVTYRDNVPFFIGTNQNKIKITPFLCDHSCPDSYMLFFEYNGRKILYTGDFRSKGRKNFDKLLSLLPKNVDTLICEGTNETAARKLLDEIAVQNKITSIMKNTDKPVFVLTSTTNIDRIVSVYKASRNNDRELLVDFYQAKILEKMGGSVPHPRKFNKVKVFFPLSLKWEKKGDFTDFRGHTKSITEIVESDGKYVMLLRSSMSSFLRKLDKYICCKDDKGLKGSVLVYSMWEGYKTKNDMRKFLNEIEKLGIDSVSIHASGHADTETIEKLIKTVNPKSIIRVHISMKQ
ncbi:MAG: MBL fold metallo-hydrolase [Clostridia bacterium]|nr:MBL fold metallo-hydrolase [Clostridia bacterium]